jgi:hypothetical protein
VPDRVPKKGEGGFYSYFKIPPDPLFRKEGGLELPICESFSIFIPYVHHPILLSGLPERISDRGMTNKEME